MSDLNRLPELSSDYALSQEQVQQFQEKGHIKLNQVATADEVAVYRTIIGEKVKELNYQSKPLEERDTYGKAFIQISNIWEKSEEVRRFVFAQRFAKIAAELLGVDGVRIYHDQALFKEPGGGITPWHQDQIYWPVDTDQFVTMWMPLVPVSEEVGSMNFASGSHKHGYISKLAISDESQKTLAQYIEAKEMEVENYGALEAGDATWHYGWTLHSAPGNPTSTMREVMTIIYYADGAKVIEPDTNARKSDLARWLPGLAPGDVAASPLNPLVYKK
ncbi:phytanoyl-CoA dioxygenase family protein [Paenibacillus sp. YYML68]|uniref:phytanoyl-CoA dioxygenase family protein n=1 Tax=Paenibacillus sp. YYML68 TaxID=2909250 RepID=UPI002491F2DB|nr:phytanoyl-CoA dioxygenase family protein [Paenibacillus sp. YYML68]